MNALDLKFIYEQLKDRYDLIVTNGFAINAGFTVDCQVLFGQSDAAKFWLYHDGELAVFETENLEGTAADHWHPEDTQEALQNVIAFMEGTCEFDWFPIEQP